jgi:Hypervirulence associated proteins TUDOR domain
MSKEFKKGDKVTWQSHGSTAEGTVEEKITSDSNTAGRQVRASKDDPQYRVRSEKSGGDAVHKPDALKKK